MGLARNKYVKEGEEGVYHCFCRCVRRAYLFGVDAATNRDYSHRKAWIVERLKFLSSIFAIDVCAYAVMSTHYHEILRTRPDIANSWSDREVASRWLQICPPKPRSKKKPPIPLETHINALLASPAKIAELRNRLCSLSWFMGRLNEFIARAANTEDKLKGCFWESRFKCQVLLDDIAIILCMAYVDLNPIYAGLAALPEDSDFTSIQERIRAWQRENMPTVASHSTPNTHSRSNSRSDSWLCPIISNAQRRGIMSISEEQYFDLVDKSGREIRAGKRGCINPDLAPILLRIGARPEAFLDTLSRFGEIFHVAAGTYSSMKKFADKIGVRWLVGGPKARKAFI
jgi:hypothetical protein